MTTTNTLTPYLLRYVGDRRRRGEITAITAKTIRNQLYPICRMFGHRPLHQLGPWLVDRWLETDQHLAPVTRAQRLCSLKNFARWLVDHDIIAKDFTRRAPRIRRPRHEPRDVTFEDFTAMLTAAGDERERAVLCLLYGCGLRCIEVVRLDIEDWDTATATITVTGKALHERTVPVHPLVTSALQSYLAVSPAPAGPLIRSIADERSRIGTSRISSLVAEIAWRAGVKHRAFDGRGAHALRAGAATDLLEACNDVRVVAEFLGHRSLSTTSIYLRRAGLFRMRDANNARQWTPGVA